MNPLYGLGGRTGRSGGGRDAGSRGRRGALPILGVLGPREAITREEAAATVTTRPVLNTERANGGDRRLRLASLPRLPSPSQRPTGQGAPGPSTGARTPPHTHTHTPRSTVTPSPASPRKAFSSSPPSVFCVLVDGALLPAGDAAFHPASCLRAATPGSPGPAGPRYGLASAHGFGQQPRTDDSRVPLSLDPASPFSSQTATCLLGPPSGHTTGASNPTHSKSNTGIPPPMFSKGGCHWPAYGSPKPDLRKTIHPRPH